MRTVFVASLFLLGVVTVGCKKGPTPISRPNFPATVEGAKVMVSEFLKPGADVGTLSKGLRPDPADYAAIFEAEAAAKIQKTMDSAWDSGQVVIKPFKPSQTELLMFSATTDDLKTGTGTAGNCPLGYKGVAQQMKPGTVVHCFKFVEPGSKVGSAFDGLIHVNGHWAWFPKPWAALK